MVEGIKNSSNLIWGITAVFAPFIGVPILIWKNWEKLTKFFTDIKKWLSNFSLYNEGLNIVSSLTKGLIDYHLKPIRAIEDIVFKMRDYLPHSPAKLGPLRDLHNVKIMDQLALAIRPAPVLIAMHEAMQKLSQAAIMPIMAPRNSFNPAFAGAGSRSNSGSNGSGYAITINVYNPVFGGSDTKSTQPFISDMKVQLTKALKDIESDRLRRRY